MSRLCVAVVLALCAVHIDAQVLGYISQSFSLIRSDTLENADYTLVNNVTARDGLSYEERVYPAAKWACTARSVPRTEASPTRSMFLDLFRYFAGDNVDKKEIDLTVPVNTFVQQRENDVTFYESCLVLPSKARSAPPKPNNPSVFIDDKPDMVILTRRVGGYFVSDTAWEEEAVSLKKLLKEKEPEADFSGYYRNGYDAPMRLFNRRNEVWYVKKGESAAVSIEEAKKKMAEDAKKTAEEAKKKEEEKLAAEAEKLKKKNEKKKTTEEKKTEEKKTEEKKTEEKKTEDKKSEEVKKVDETKKVEAAPVEETKKVEAAADDKKVEPAENRE